MDLKKKELWHKKKKKLLLKDLCARLPYGVKITWDGKYSLTVTPHIYSAIVSENNIDNLPKLLLRPMSSMTEEEDKEYKKVIELELKALEGPDGHTIVSAAGSAFEIDFYNKYHFDYRGLIEKGLALEAPEGMYK